MRTIIRSRRTRMKSFAGKVAVVTGGGGSGIGHALVVELARAGAHVAFCDIAKLESTEEEIAALGVPYLALKVDMSDRTAIDGFIDAVLDRFGQIDLLFNNAGIALGDRTFDELTAADFDRITDINYWGVVHTTQKAYPSIRQRPEAAIINISSAQGILALPYMIPYCTTKFAVRGFTDSLRAEHRLRGIKNVTVHTVHPGRVATNITVNSDYQTETSMKFHENLQKGISAADAAKVILKGVQKNKGRIVISDGKVHDLLARILPTANTHIVRLELRRQGVIPR
ncbi:SDR family NAD(P)-dependent oxidoreductase [Georgenia sp. TF02-10]|uniref:SDR family NAD(P)-dependent oxidoreductase n=1 Tax=Georgenia sp. TF02-10 TaxID=2917725 RepID=UPI001FA80A8D|nr:SDR family NAD(P)-dependent oxidoreductase [Georgenia sp. TF02-10]UNX55607.1 SDR family NAD(P)-dependent oxidoreductase [Georgenia sp. TF02-10]